MSRGGEKAKTYSSPTIDDIWHEQSIIAHEHHNIHEGLMFSACNLFNAIPLNGVAEIILNNPSDNYPHIIFNAESFLSGKLELIEGVTFTSSGTTMTANNHNRSSLNTANLEVTHTPIDATINSLSLDISLMGGGKSGKGAGGSKTFDREFILSPSKKYLARYTSFEASNTASICISFYEKNF